MTNRGCYCGVGSAFGQFSTYTGYGWAGTLVIKNHGSFCGAGSAFGQFVAYRWSNFLSYLLSFARCSQMLGLSAFH